MKELKASTKAGQAIIKRGIQYEGGHLKDVYSRYSNEKEMAYDWCIQEYIKTQK